MLKTLGREMAEELGLDAKELTGLQAALEPSAYRAVYRSLHKIVLDNKNLAQPALSVADVRGAMASSMRLIFFHTEAERKEVAVARPPARRGVLVVLKR